MITRRSVSLAIPLFLLPRVCLHAEPWVNVDFDVGDIKVADDITFNFNIPEINLDVNIKDINIEFIAVINYLGYAQGIYNLAKLIGIAPSNNKAIMKGLKAIAAKIDAAKEEIINWLEDQELREHSSRLLSIPKNIEAYSISKVEIFKQTTRSNIVTTLNELEPSILLNISRVSREQNTVRALHYLGLFALQLSSRQMFANLVRDREQNPNEAKTIYNPSSKDMENLEKLKKLANQNLASYLDKNLVLKKRRIKSTGGRIQGRSVTYQFGFVEFVSFKSVGKPFRVWEPGEKTAENTGRYNKEQKEKMRIGNIVFEERKNEAVQARNARYEEMYREFGKRFAVFQEAIEQSKV